MKNIFAQSPDKEAENILYATGKLLQLLHVKVTSTTLKKTLLSNPHYLSLFSISESLQKWNIESSALQISPQELDEIKLPCIAYLAAGRKFIVITKVSAEYVEYFDDKDTKQQSPRNNFINIWDGIVLLAEPLEKSGEPDYKNMLRKEVIHQYKIPLLLLFFISLSFLKLYQLSNAAGNAAKTFFPALLFCKITGLVISCLLLLYEFDNQNSFVKQICAVGNKTNCSSVLSSRWSKITKWLSWSEVGFIYFFGGWLLLMTTGTSLLPWLYFTNLLAVPLIILSVYFQAVKIRQWCIFCLAVQGLLLAEILSGSYAYPTISMARLPAINADSFGLIFLSFILPVFAWFFAKPFIYASRTGINLQYQLARFKNSPDVFYGMLQKQPAVSRNSIDLGIMIGNPAAENTLIKVCNPFCGPCAKAHPAIDALIHNNANWKVQIIFSAKPVENEKYMAVNHLMTIAEKNKTEKKEWITQQALDDWYGSAKNNDDRYQNFSAKYPLDSAIETQESKINAMYEWCEVNAVRYTPTFFVNGHRLPEQYDIADLQYL